MAITVDNASNNNVFCRDFIEKGLLKDGEHHIRCFAHILNLACKDALEFFSPGIKSLREGIKAVRGCNSRLQRFRKLCELENVQFIKPILDVETRWNSQYDMLVTAERLKKPLKMIFNELVGKRIGEEIFLGAGEEDWEAAKNVREFLEPFKAITLDINGEKYPTLSKMMGYFDDLLDHAEKFEVLSLILVSF